MTNFEYKFNLKNENETFFRKTYPVPLKYRDAADKEIEKLIEMNILEKSTSDCINPLVVNIKKPVKLEFALMQGN